MDPPTIEQQEGYCSFGECSPKLVGRSFESPFLCYSAILEPISDKTTIGAWKNGAKDAVIAVLRNDDDWVSWNLVLPTHMRYLAHDQDRRQIGEEEEASLLLVGVGKNDIQWGRGCSLATALKYTLQRHGIAEMEVEVYELDVLPHGGHAAADDGRPVASKPVDRQILTLWHLLISSKRDGLLGHVKNDDVLASLIQLDRSLRPLMPVPGQALQAHPRYGENLDSPDDAFLNNIVPFGTVGCYITFEKMGSDQRDDGKRPAFYALTARHAVVGHRCPPDETLNSTIDHDPTA